MEVGNRVQLISVPNCSKEDLNRFGTVMKIGNNTPYGKNVDIFLDGDEGISAVFDHQLKFVGGK